MDVRRACNGICISLGPLQRLTSITLYFAGFRPAVATPSQNSTGRPPEVGVMARARNAFAAADAGGHLMASICN
jgi:hypothetical protein